jgi:hypothetical protein
MHEVSGHASLPQLLGARRYASLIRRARELVDDGDPIAILARNRIPCDTADDQLGDELVSYLIEEAANAPGYINPALQAWLDDVIAALRAWFVASEIGLFLCEHGMELDLSTQDITALALVAVRWRSRRLH